MDALALIESAKQAGLALEIDGDQLRVRGPKDAEVLVRQLAEHKAAVIEALTTGSFEPDWASDARRVIDSLPEEHVRVVLLDYFEESAAFIEFEQNKSRSEAEQQAFGLLIYRLIWRELKTGATT